MDLGLMQGVEAVMSSEDEPLMCSAQSFSVSARSKRYHKRTREQFTALQALDEQLPSKLNSHVCGRVFKKICTEPGRTTAEQGSRLEAGLRNYYQLALDETKLNQQLAHLKLCDVDAKQHPPRYPFVDTPFTIDISLVMRAGSSTTLVSNVHGVAMVTLLFANGEPANQDYLRLEEPTPSQRAAMPWSPTNPGVLPVVNGVLQFRSAITRLSAQERGRLFMLRVTLGGSTGIIAHPLDIGPLKVVRYKLQITKEPEPYFFKDQGGQRHGLECSYQLVESPTASSQPLPESVTLKVGLVYEDLKVVDLTDSPKDILLSPKSAKRGHKRSLTHAIMDGRTRKGSIKYRIEECSSVGHKNRAFRLTICADEQNPKLLAVAPCFTRKTHVMAKDLWKEKLKKSCKLYHWDDTQCHNIHEDYKRQQSHPSAKPDPYKRWKSGLEVRTWMRSEEGRAFSNTSYGHKKTHSRLRNPVTLPPLPPHVKREDCMMAQPPRLGAMLPGMTLDDIGTMDDPFFSPMERFSAMERITMGRIKNSPMSDMEERTYSRILQCMGSAQKIATRLSKEGYVITAQSVLPILLEDLAGQRHIENLRTPENPREISPAAAFSNPPSESTTPEISSRKSSLESAPSHKSSFDSCPSRKSSLESCDDDECFSPATRQDRSAERSRPHTPTEPRLYAHVGTLPPLPVPGTPLLGNYNAIFPTETGNRSIQLPGRNSQCNVSITIQNQDRHSNQGVSCQRGPD